MKLIIEVDEKRFEEIKQIANAQFELKNKTEAQIIANGKPYDDSGDLISREALKKAIKDNGYSHYFEIFDIIDNAQAIPLPNEQTAWEQGYEVGLAQGKQDRPQGEWELIKYQHSLNKYRCNLCQHYIYSGMDRNFCPNCGADMRGGAE